MENTVLHPVDNAAVLVGGRDALAKLLGVTVSAIGNWKVRGVPFEQCRPIELATNGKVTRRDLRPDDWMKHWPELAEAPATPAQTATETVAIEAVVEEAKATLEDVAETMKVEIKHLAEEVRASLERPSPPWDGVTERRHPDAPFKNHGRGV